jgi:hypothetical protein
MLSKGANLEQHLHKVLVAGSHIFYSVLRLRLCDCLTTNGDIFLIDALGSIQLWPWVTHLYPFVVQNCISSGSMQRRSLGHDFVKSPLSVWQC